MLMMLPFEAPTIFEGIHKSYFRMPRVVKDQRSKFENDDLFRQLSHESAIKYTGFKDRPLEERQMKFIANCQEGHTEVSVVQSGSQFTLMFNPAANPAYNNEGCDFDKELGKVHIKSGFILNGVCVLWRGWVDLQRLEGFGCLEFDEYRAYLEDAMAKQQIDKQQSCNSSANTQPIGRLNHHIGAQIAQSINPAAAAAAAAAVAASNNSLLPPAPPAPTGGNLNQSCLGGAPTLVPPTSVNQSIAPPSSQATQLGGLPTHPPPVSLADSAAAAHYGNAAIAAAAAAAFHQALSVSGAGGGLGPPLHSQSLHGLSASGSPSALTAATNGTVPSSHSLAAQHLPYTNGTTQPIIPSTNNNNNTSPQHHHHHHQLMANGLPSGPAPPPPPPNSTTHMQPNHQTRTPERENHYQNHNLGNNNSSNHQSNGHTKHRQATKRPQQEEQTQLDEVDVVSDITAHDLDFPPPPPRRIFKSDQISSNNNHVSAHHHHNHHHKAKRVAQ